MKRLCHELLTWSLPAVTRVTARAGRVAIFMAHGVHESRFDNTPGLPSSSISVNALERCLRTISKSFRFVTMDEALAICEGAKEQPRPCAVLTFDDSLKCLVELAAPLLMKLGIPATFYVSTEAIDSARPYWWLRLDYALAGSPSAGALKRELREGAPECCEPKVTEIETQTGRSLLAPGVDWPFAVPMSWDDVRTLQRSGMTVGSHTVTHPNLAAVRNEMVLDELTRSRERIEQETSAECRHFCYPYGAHSEKVCNAARRAGYRTAVTIVQPGWNTCGDDLFRLRRFALPNESFKLGRMLAV